MVVKLEEKLGALATKQGALTFNRGIEREALRVDAQGNLARTPHPAFLGSKLTHPTITTDFSESQLELITPVSTSVDETLADLEEIHRFVHSGLVDEILWSSSMPCVLQGDNSIPLAQYGTSNLGRLKTTYRNGLGHRYGRAMQTICAVHYNFSFNDGFWVALAANEGTVVNKDYISQRYFDLMRNFRRLSWLPVYLFGASPAVCNSFVKGRSHSLERFDEGSMYAKGATSLRSGNLGYQSDIQRNAMNVCYNSIESYVASLAEAITTTHKVYEDIGLKRGDEYLQVNAGVIQSEAEFYTSIRAKRVPPKGTNFLKVLLAGGVEYLEVRLLDVNPYLPLGIDAEEVKFLDMMLLYSLLTPSTEHDDLLCKAVATNVQNVVWRGREPQTMLDDFGTERSVADWGGEVLAGIAPIAAAMDRANGGTDYTRTLDSQLEKVADPNATPSARVLADMKSESIPFFRFAMNKALAHREFFTSEHLPKDRSDFYNSLAEQSHIDQQKIEDDDEIDFDAYLTRLNSEYRDLL